MAKMPPELEAMLKLAGLAEETETSPGDSEIDPVDGFRLAASLAKALAGTTAGMLAHMEWHREKSDYARAELITIQKQLEKSFGFESGLSNEQLYEAIKAEAAEQKLAARKAQAEIEAARKVAENWRADGAEARKVLEDIGLALGYGPDITEGKPRRVWTAFSGHIEGYRLLVKRKKEAETILDNMARAMGLVPNSEPQAVWEMFRNYFQVAQAQGHIPPKEPGVESREFIRAAGLDPETADPDFIEAMAGLAKAVGWKPGPDDAEMLLAKYAPFQAARANALAQSAEETSADHAIEQAAEEAGSEMARQAKAAAEAELEKARATRAEIETPKPAGETGRGPQMLSLVEMYQRGLISLDGVMGDLESQAPDEGPAEYPDEGPTGYPGDGLGLRDS